jgi:hypothetical protein
MGFDLGKLIGGMLPRWTMLVFGQACMLAPWPVIRGLGAIVTLLGLLSVISAASPPAVIEADYFPRRTIVGAIVGIGLLAGIFRTAYLLDAPAGLYVDEVYTARNALIWRLSSGTSWCGALPLIEAGWVETSNLYLAYVSAVMSFFGDDAFGIRMASVLPSFATVAVAGGIAACLGNARAALWTTLFLAASHWAARTGRTGWDQGMMTFLQYGSLLAMLLSLRQAKPVVAAAYATSAGCLMGLCLYTYVASRLAAVHLLVWGMWEMLGALRRCGPRLRVITGTGWRWAVAAAVATLVFSPYAHYLATRSLAGSHVRTQELWLFRNGVSHGFVELANSILAHLMMFHGAGGTYARDNTPDAPMLDPITGLALLLGLAWTFKAGRTPGQETGARLLLSLFPVVLLGGVLSSSREGPPYVYRVANVAPWACIVAGLGASTFQLRGPGLPASWSAPQRRRAVTAVAVACLTVGLNAGILWFGYAKMPDFVTAFGTLENRLGRFVEQHSRAVPVLVHWQACQTMPRFRAANRHPEINGYNWFRPEASITAIHLAAGVYRHQPELALDPLTVEAPVILIRSIPYFFPFDHGYLALKPDARPELHERFRVSLDQRITDRFGRTMCDVYEVTARVASSAESAW